MKHKYNAIRTVIDGISFASKREAARYAELKLLERGGVISCLNLQPRFTLQAEFVYRGKKYRAIEYVADFEYMERGKIIVEDVKGFVTPIYKLKLKMFLKYISSRDYEFREIK